MAHFFDSHRQTSHKDLNDFTKKKSLCNNLWNSNIEVTFLGHRKICPNFWLNLTVSRGIIWDDIRKSFMVWSRWCLRLIAATGCDIAHKPSLDATPAIWYFSGSYQSSIHPQWGLCPMARLDRSPDTRWSRLHPIRFGGCQNWRFHYEETSAIV